MGRLARRLEQAGHRVVNVGYPSRDAPIDVLARDAVAPALAGCDRHAPLHVVTHSMGGILLRRALHDDPGLRRPERVVMLGPPNHGSEVVDRLAPVPGLGWVLGPAGRALGTRGEGVARDLPPRLPDGVEVGVVAGDRSFNLVFSRMLPGPDDGAVTVASTRLEAMTDHVVLPVPHMLLMTSRVAIDHTLHFLAHGAFPG